MPSDSYPLFLFFGTVGFLIFLVRAALNYRRQSANLRANLDLQEKLLDKVTSNDELRTYLEKDGARMLVETLRPQPKEAYYRLLLPVIPGCVLVFAGAGLRYATAELGISRTTPVLTVISYVALATGVGFLVAVFASHWLSKSWGLIGKDEVERK
jgi:hypothetical protein